MFYRRKIILALIELLGGEVKKLRFQKLLFLYATKKKEPEYDFIPYKFGCYSYSANADMNAMVKRGILSETEDLYVKLNQTEFYKELKQEDQKLLQEVISDYGEMSSSALIKHTYINFPFYAIRSTIAHDVLPEKLYERVEEAKPQYQQSALFTIGYQGISLEKYLKRLIENDVKLLVDVRKNALSMKFGFSKTLLKRYCNSVGIEYIHIPEVGIESDKRKELKTQEDYDDLFMKYRQTTLANTQDAQLKILELVKEYKRIALTCFEADPIQCHRTQLAESIHNMPEFNYPLIHI